MSTYSFREKNSLKRIGWAAFDTLVEQVFDNATQKLTDNVEKWAGRTYQDFVNNTPVDTGNLQESIDIDENEMPYAITVGVNESELIGPKKLRSRTYFTPKRGLGQMRTIPARNYVLDSDTHGTPLEERTRDLSLRMFVSKIWQEQARLNAYKYLRRL